MPLVIAANGPLPKYLDKSFFFFFLIFNQNQMSNESKMVCQLKLSVRLSVYHIYLSTVFIFLCEV